MEGKDDPLEFKRVLDNIKVGYSTLWGLQTSGGSVFSWHYK